MLRSPHCNRVPVPPWRLVRTRIPSHLGRPRTAPAGSGIPLLRSAPPPARRAARARGWARAEAPRRRPRVGRACAAAAAEVTAAVRPGSKGRARQGAGPAGQGMEGRARPGPGIVMEKVFWWPRRRIRPARTDDWPPAAAAEVARWARAWPRRRIRPGGIQARGCSRSGRSAVCVNGQVLTLLLVSQLRLQHQERPPGARLHGVHLPAEGDLQRRPGAPPLQVDKAEAPCGGGRRPAEAQHDAGAGWAAHLAHDIGQLKASDGRVVYRDEGIAGQQVRTMHA